MQVDKGYVFNVLVSIAYMTVDYMDYHFNIPDKTILNKQTMWHHIMAISGFGIALVAGYGMPGVSSASLLCEYSNIFLSYKDMFTKETRNSTSGIIVQVCFFVSYTVFRFILFPFLTYRTFTVAILSWSLVGFLRKIAMIYCVIQAILVLFLNMYWYLLILKGVKRLLETLGIIKKPVNDDYYKDIEKYEASANTQLAENM